MDPSRQYNTSRMNRLGSAVPAEQYLGNFGTANPHLYWLGSVLIVWTYFCLLFFPPVADSQVLFYLNDAVTQLLDHKEEYTQFGLVRYFAE